LDPETDWISFLLKPDPDYPKRYAWNTFYFFTFDFFLQNFFDDLRDLMLDDEFMLLCNLPRTVDFAVHITVVTCVAPT